MAKKIYERIIYLPHIVLDRENLVRKAGTYSHSIRNRRQKHGFNDVDLSLERTHRT